MPEHLTQLTEYGQKNLSKETPHRKESNIQPPYVSFFLKKHFIALLLTDFFFKKNSSKW